MGQGVTLVDGHSVGDTITRVHHDTSGTTRGIQGQHSLDGNIHGGGVEGLEHDLEREGWGVNFTLKTVTAHHPHIHAEVSWKSRVKKQKCRKKMVAENCKKAGKV